MALVAVSCGNGNRGEVHSGERYHLLEEVPLADNGFESREFRNDLYTVDERAWIHDSVGNVIQLHANEEGIYFSDKEAIHRYRDGTFATVYVPSKGRGPNEVPQVFRFDIRHDDVIAISGYPEFRVLLHQLGTGRSKLIETGYRGNVLIDKRLNIYGESTAHPSSYMITRFNAEGDSAGSFGRFFSNQQTSLNMFDFYWDYNDTHDLIVIGFMYAGYYLALQTDGTVLYAVESIRHPGYMPAVVRRGGMQYVDAEGKSILRGITTAGDEMHVYTAKAMNSGREVYGAVIDVLDVASGEYKFSYLLEEPLHWPVELTNDYHLISITESYELVKWKRNTPP